MVWAIAAPGIGRDASATIAVQGAISLEHFMVNVVVTIVVAIRTTTAKITAAKSLRKHDTINLWRQ